MTKGFYWDGGSVYSKLPLQVTHGSAFPATFSFDDNANCMRMKNYDTASDPVSGCEGSNFAQVCVISFGGPGMGQSISK